MPSLLCYKETAQGAWVEHYCLVKSDTVFPDEDSATAMATEHLDEAVAADSPAEVGLSLRHAGYKTVDDFRVISRIF